MFRRANLAIIVVIVLWGLITHASYAGTGDEPHYMMIAYSLAFDRDVDLTHDYENMSNRALGGHFEAGAHARPDREGRLRPVHDIGLPLLFAPYYALAYGLTSELVDHVPEAWLRRARLTFTVIQRQLLSLAMIAITAAIALTLFDLFRELSGSDRRAFGWAALAVLSPPILSHSFLFFTEILSAFIAVRVFVWLRNDRQKSAGGVFVAGLAAGYLLLVHTRNIGLVTALCLLALYRSRRWPDSRSRLAWFAAGVAVLLAVRTGVIHYFWGTWVTTPLATVDTAYDARGFATEALTRLAGWLFDQEHGLLPYAPAYLLVPAGWWRLWRRDRALCLELTCLIAAYVGVMTIPTLNAAGWRGGWSPAARFLVPVAPFLAVLMFAAVAELKRVPLVVMLIVVVQVGLDAVLWQHPGLLWNDGTGSSALLRYLGGDTGSLQQWIPSLLPPIATKTVLTIVGMFVGWTMLTAALIPRRGDIPSGGEG